MAVDASRWERFHEPLWRTLVRNVLIAAAAGTIVALRMRHLSSVGTFALLAMWFTFGGHYAEVLFLNVVRDSLPASRGAQRVGRLVLWFVSGCVLYLGLTATQQLISGEHLPYSRFWIGGLLLIGIELIVHLVGVLRGTRNFYSGTG